MKTSYASPERKSGPALDADIRFAGENPLIATLLRSVSGLLAVLNSERQVLAVNEEFLRSLGFKDGKDLLGLRPGEVVECLHARDGDGGCGTGSYCSSCGAAVAIVTALSEKGPVERKCVIETSNGSRSRDLHLAVRADRFDWEGNSLVLLFMRDIAEQERRVSLERVFFLDINNTILALSGLVDTHRCVNEDDSGEFRKSLSTIVSRLKKEIELQRTLSEESGWEVRPEFRPVRVKDVFDELEEVMEKYPVASNARLVLRGDDSPIPLRTDRNILIRILTNLILNALEASDGSEVRVWNERGDSHIVFRVWNDTGIDDEVALRIFQKHFTTKEEPGRGFGTYSAKYLSEEILGGHLEFESSEEKGTTFTLELPVYGN